MGVFRIVLGAMRGASTIGAVAIDRLAVDSVRPVARGTSPVDVAEPRETGLEAFFPSQAENAALLDLYVVGPARRR